MCLRNNTLLRQATHIMCDEMAKLMHVPNPIQDKCYTVFWFVNNSFCVKLYNTLQVCDVVRNANPWHKIKSILNVILFFLICKGYIFAISQLC